LVPSPQCRRIFGFEKDAAYAGNALHKNSLLSKRGGIVSGIGLSVVDNYKDGCDSN
jgi:hypothetical protein